MKLLIENEVQVKNIHDGITIAAIYSPAADFFAAAFAMLLLFITYDDVRREAGAVTLNLARPRKVR